MATEVDYGSDQQELGVLLIITVLSLVIGFLGGLLLWRTYHPRSIILFIFSFGLAFAVLLALVCMRVVIGLLGGSNREMR